MASPAPARLPRDSPSAALAHGRLGRARRRCTQSSACASSSLVRAEKKCSSKGVGVEVAGVGGAPLDWSWSQGAPLPMAASITIGVTAAPEAVPKASPFTSIASTGSTSTHRACSSAAAATIAAAAAAISGQWRCLEKREAPVAHTRREQLAVGSEGDAAGWRGQRALLQRGGPPRAPKQHARISAAARPHLGHGGVRRDAR